MRTPQERQPCTGRLHKEFACNREFGHSGVHLSEILFNGTLCEMGWRDSDKGAWRGTPVSVKA